MSRCKECGYELPEGAVYCPRCGTPVVKEEAPAQAATSAGHAAPISQGLKLALWWERFVAWLIDVILIGLILSLVGALTFVSLRPFTFLPGWLDWIPFFNFGVSGVVNFLYWMLMDGAYGQSFGKMVMRIRVTRVDGSRVNMTGAALESIGKAFLLPLDCLLGWILYPRRRQRVFNYISETIVVKIT